MPETTADEEAVVNGKGQEIAPAGRAAASTALTGDPAKVMERSAELAKNLQDFVRAQGLTVRFGKSEHLQVEAWQFIGQQIGVFAVPGDPEPVERDGDSGYVCRTELVDHLGNVIGRGTGRCMRSEHNWRSADEYAVESMAQTRSIGKAFRNSYGFIAKAAGFSPTPAEEMSPEMRGNGGEARVATPTARGAQRAPRASAERPEETGGRLATVPQRKKIFAKFKQHGSGAENELRAILVWTAGTEHSDRIPFDKVDEVLAAVTDAEGTLAQITEAAADPDRPDGPEAREIVDRYLRPSGEEEAS